MSGPYTPTKRTAIHIAAMARPAQTYLFCTQCLLSLLLLAPRISPWHLAVKAAAIGYSLISSANPNIAVPAMAAPK
jgi:hypothetical protein